MSTPVFSRAVAAFLLCIAVSATAADARNSRDLLWDSILFRHVHDGVVSYTDIKADTAFAIVVKKFAATDPQSITDKNSRLAFWINAYNVFTVKLIVDHFPVKSINDVAAKPWDERFITIHGQTYSLNQIENEIIRKQFAEPRIHFALVCAAKGCPPLRSEAYTGAALEKQLEHNLRRFMQDPKKNRFDAPSGTLFLSSIFDWYKNDFIAKAGSVQEFVRPYITPRSGITPQTPIRYTEYDWSLNGK